MVEWVRSLLMTAWRDAQLRCVGCARRNKLVDKATKSWQTVLELGPLDVEAGTKDPADITMLIHLQKAFGHSAASCGVELANSLFPHMSLRMLFVSFNLALGTSEEPA